MNEKNQEGWALWIIHWIDPYDLECKSGTREEVEAYAEEKARKTGNTYEIN